MENIIDPIDDLIGKLLAGEASEQEKIHVENWLQASDANRKYFGQLKTIFEKAASPSVQVHFDTDEAWRKVRERLHDPKRLGMPSGRKTIGFQRMIKIAASLFLTVALGYALYVAVRPRVEVKSFSSGAATVQDTLPDGSIAFLNRKSEVRFEYNSREKNRMVNLKGEAFFEVKHENERPFIIETNEVMIRDLGTAFNVKAYPESNTVEVMVEEGEVQFYTRLDSGLNLLAGEKGIYDKLIKKFSRIVQPDTNRLSYKTKVFSFDNSDLGSVVDKLNEVYNAEIRLANDDLKNCHLTVNFNDDKLETVIDVLAETLNLTVSRHDDEIILDGKGCH